MDHKVSYFHFVETAKLNLPKGFVCPKFDRIVQSGWAWFPVQRVVLDF